MFYSQFILAKKGPLGTIWIAAHLERKLRKNQVADTDIGVSVDSIIFPEVPIALRLSSHLLLGVVRIYSKKVNYLFHDCSEALLKVKQAFRSSAVDLPPEESTAPYHSITLPETFHLDDFELPDSTFQGDFVDHHVSTKEQITLQDTMDRTGFSTMQFGLDERFGDGNSSHIGLDFDEDLFLDKHATTQVDFFTLSHEDRVVQPGQCSSSFPGSAMDVDDSRDNFLKETKVEALEPFSELANEDDDGHEFSSVVGLRKNDATSHSQVFDIRTPDLNLLFFQNDHSGMPPGTNEQIGTGTTVEEIPVPDSAECGHVPSTPGLLVETSSAFMPESPALSPQVKTSSSNIEAGFKCNNSVLHPDCPDSDTNNALKGVGTETMSLENGNIESSISVISERVSSITLFGEMLNEQNKADVLLAENVNSEMKGQLIDDGAYKYEVPAEDSAFVENTPIVPMTEHGVSYQTTTEDKEPHLEVSDELLDKSSDMSKVTDGSILQSENQPNQLNFFSSCELAEPERAQSVQDVSNLQNENLPDQINYLSTSELAETERAQSVQDIGNLQNENVPDQINYFSASELAETERAQSIQNLSNLQNENRPDQINCFSSCELSEPEKMLFAPPGGVNLANELSQVTFEKTITESDGSVNKMTGLSGKKRRLMESASLLQDESFAKNSDRQRIRTSADHVPKDDDLLASILVGHRTPLFRIAPTPPPIVPSSRHPRTTKRKVVLDDATVLHADAIRHQLINTEDIRRIRKKAPCTRTEIWFIERKYLEDEIFDVPVLTGTSSYLHSLLDRRYNSETNHHSALLKKNDVAVDGELVSKTVDNQNVLNPISPEKSERHGPLEDNDECVAQQHLETISGLPLPELSNNDLQSTMFTIDPIEQEKNAEVDVQGQITSHCSIVDETHETVAEQIENGDVQFIKNDAAFNVGEDEPQSMFVDDNAFPVAQNKDAAQHTVADQIQIGNAQFEKNDATINTSEGESQGMFFDDNIYLAARNEDACATMEPTLPLDIPSAAKTENVMILPNVDNNLPEFESATVAIPPGTSSLSMVGETECDGAVLESITGHGGLHEMEGTFGAAEAESLLHKDVHNEESHIASDVFSEKSGMAASTLAPPSSEIGIFPSTVGENTICHEFNRDGSVAVESAALDLTGGKECSDFCSAIDGNDTEFLNVDDEVDYDEEADNDEANPQDARSLENSGWSSRTRGVARYLQTIFDEESGLGRKDVTIDRLLSGKTRKEASRMFFETLVLKTKDYIHVEQDNPFDCITIKPKARLLKSEF